MKYVVIVTGLALVLAGCDGAAEKGVSHDALSKDIAQTLVLDASGCVATGPDGNPLQLPAPTAGGQISIPKGSTFTLECFRNGEKNAGR